MPAPLAKLFLGSLPFSGDSSLFAESLQLRGDCNVFVSATTSVHLSLQLANLICLQRNKNLGSVLLVCFLVALFKVCDYYINSRDKEQHMVTLVEEDSSVQSVCGALQKTSLNNDSGSQVQQHHASISKNKGIDDDQGLGDLQLGYVTSPEDQYALLHDTFPSKAGGVPVWLDPVNLPCGGSCVCDFCKEPLQFILQVYAPISSKESGYHRTIFVFMCTSMGCLRMDQSEQKKQHSQKEARRSVKVFRCQLPHVNPFYSTEDNDCCVRDICLFDRATLCSWCGTWKGAQLCGGCRKARYCSKKHQVMHWRSGHKGDCQQQKSSHLSKASFTNGKTTSVDTKNAPASNTLWPEYEIRFRSSSRSGTVYEDDDSASSVGLSESDTESLGNNEGFSLVSSSNVVDEEMDTVPNGFAGENIDSFMSFEQQVKKAPWQILRCWINDGKPLWPMSSGQPSNSDIPKCSNCGGLMYFEFQIMPQLLHYFNVKDDVDSLDWATIAIYTCQASCDSSIAYKEEFAWVQLYSSTAATAAS